MPVLSELATHSSQHGRHGCSASILHLLQAAGCSWVQNVMCTAFSLLQAAHGLLQATGAAFVRHQPFKAPQLRYEVHAGAMALPLLQSVAL